jgi:hypothetical protein
MRHNLLYDPTGHHGCSLSLYTVYFFNEANQTEEVFDPEKSAPGRDSNERIHGSDVRPVKRYGGSAPLRVKK